ncbi:hypothetical protein LPW11_19320 [Geomonas sp. RF6]|uniref:hypothetical protein n=1 Tax=Geomonas sp. RF6 TaxID=2897342 RepID=UPI001E30C6BA|nr:hypothetical protein [Geomonas sp. RF6]UFS70018.1 hypothetical protein LPW11_19320 [Geomonas sp. RF6]
MKTMQAHSAQEEKRGSMIWEYAIMLALVVAICVGAFFTLEDMSPHLSPVETTVVSP